MSTIPSNIIPHNPINVQVGIREITDEIQTFCNTNQILTFGLSSLQREAYDLYDLGLNVLPQPRGQKGGLPWKRLQYSRLNRNDPNYGLRNLFAGDCNLAIMCGKTSGNLFVIDCESIDIFHYYLQQLVRRKIPVWASQTARGGHIYLKAKNGEVHNIEPGILTDAEIKGRNGYVLAPPSIHPSGAVYRWVAQQGDTIPEIDVNEVDWLMTKNQQSVHLEYDKPTTSKPGNWSMAIVSPASNLSRTTRDYLDSGNRIREGNRNNRLFKAACDMSGNGYSHSEAENILTPIAAMSGLAPAEIKATITSAYSRQRTPSRPITEVKLSYNWRYAILWAINHQWDTRTAGTDRALFLALIERARVSSNDNDVFRASIRELSQLARLGTTTIQRALSRLEDMQLIFSCGNDHISQASLWRFSDKVISVAKEIELNLDTVSIPPHWLRFSESLFNSDVSERGALGHSVLFVYEFMRTLHKPMMPSDMAESTDISVNQINYALRKLREHNLVHRFDTGWYLTKMTIPELEAMFEEVAGKGDARVSKYRAEREVFAGVILFNARIRREGRAFMDAVSEQVHFDRQAKRIVDDPLLLFALELGGVPRMDFRVH